MAPSVVEMLADMRRTHLLFVLSSVILPARERARERERERDFSIEIKGNDEMNEHFQTLGHSRDKFHNKKKSLLQVTKFP